MIVFQGTNINPQWQAWADIAEMPEYPGSVLLQEEPATFSCGAAAGDAGCTSGFTIQISVKDVPFNLQGYEYHEMGHVFDNAELGDPDRQAFMDLWGLPGGADAWRTTFPNSNGSPAEWWAEGYRLCSRWGANMPDSAYLSDFVVYGYPGLKQPAVQRQVCQLILRIGQQQGIASPPQAVYSAAFPANPATFPTEWPAQPTPTVTPTSAPVSTPPRRRRHHKRRHHRHHYKGGTMTRG